MKLVIGVADDATSVDALAFGATVARTYDAHLSIVTVSATADEYINDHLDPRWQKRRGDESSELVERMAQQLSAQYGITAQTVVHHHRSLGQGLSEIAATRMRAALGEHGVLMQASPDDALATIDDEAEEPRLPVTAGLLSMFLPGTGQLLNGDVGRASLVFAVWSLAWITQLSPVWTFVCLYAGAEAFFTAKIRSMERKLAKEAALGPGNPPPTAGQLPPKPSST